MKNAAAFKVTLLLLAGIISTHVIAADLKIGDPAPKLQTGKWVQGEPVKTFDKDKAYIVEFWATWCGPCRTSIPHLNEIHKKYVDKGLVVIGQDCWEQDDSKVEPFIKTMGEKMTYRVALDDKTTLEKGAMAQTWMMAAEQNGIPSAFIVNKEGLIAWIGHPMSLKESVIEEVLAGKFDIAKAAADFAAQKANESQLTKFSRQLSKQMKDKDWTAAESTVAEMEKVFPEADREKIMGSTRLQILLGKGDLDGAAKLALRLSDLNKDNAAILNQLAWELVKQPGIKGTALDVSAKIAARANEVSNGKDAAILDTLARTAFIQGAKDKAKEFQEKAVGLAEGDTRKSLQKTLDSYKEDKLPSAE